ncbi:MAG: hypothetical protein RLZZ165_752 [Bacteroidota bacterium]|jgi:gliding motility-associated-like protein
MLRLLWLTIALTLVGNARAYHDHADSSGIRFIANKGQWEPQVIYAADLPGGRIFLEKDRLTYAFCDVGNLHEQMFHHSPGKPVDSTLRCHAFSVKFAGSLTTEAILGESKVPEYHNYFHGNDSSKWASLVPLFRQVRYRNLYPGIDFVIYAKDRGLKYDFVVRPGADPDRIGMVYEGLEKLEIQNGELKLVTSVNEITERRPIAFQNETPLACAFSLQDKIISFYFPDGYRDEHELVIDPTMIFSTFSGSYANNFGFSATYDASGNLYAGGIAFSRGYPVTNGSYQTTFAGEFDISITKFSSTGGLLFSTYLGGSGQDQPHSMVTDLFGNLLIYGMTRSRNFPTSSFAYDRTLDGPSDIYVSKISPNGASLLASTLIGGTGSDALNINNNDSQSSLKYNYGDDARGEINTDDNGNVYIASCTQSRDFPTTQGAFRPQSSGSQDGVVFKFNPALSSLTWSTHLGGSGDDAAYSIKIDPAYGVYVCGGTASSNFPTTVGTLSASYRGGIDGFITHLNSTGTGMIASTFIGTGAYDQTYFLEVDADGDVYVVGQTRGSMPITPGVWSMGTTGQFIQKLSPDLARLVYSTAFGAGGSVNISPTAFLVDVCEYVYVSGWGGSSNFSGTGSTKGLPTTSNAYQRTTDGSDFYLIVLKTDASSLHYATFMGGSVSQEHVDGGTSRFSKRAEVYQTVCAGCFNNSDFPTTPGAFSSTNNAGSGGCNLACFKMDLDLEGITAAFQPLPAMAGCAPHSVQFQNRSIGGTSWLWNFGDPGSGPSNTSTATNPSHTFQNPGLYRVTLILSDPNSCNGSDTSYRTIRVYATPQLSLAPSASVCKGQSVTLQASGGQNYAWSPSTGLSSTTSANPVATLTTTQTYTVITTNQGGCADTGQVTVTVLPSPIADAGEGGFICPGNSIQLDASGGGSYSWSNGATLSNPSIPNPIAFPNQTTNYVLTVTAANGCTDTDTVTVSVSTVRAQPGPNVDLCTGSSIQLNGSGGGTYFWQPPTGLSATNIPDPVAHPTASTTYFLTVSDGAGCTHTDSLRVSVHPLPSIDVGSDFIMCENDTVQLQATGAQSYSWSPATALSNPLSGSPMAFPIRDIIYVATGTDQFGCQDQDTLAIQVLPAPIANAWGGKMICEDSSLQVFSSGGVTYSWIPPTAFNDPHLQNPIVTLTATTDLVVTALGANGCRDRDTVHVPVTPTPVIRVVGPKILCKGESTALLASGGETYLWSTGATTPRINVRPQASTVYTVWAYINGCPSKPDSIFMMVDTVLPVANFFADPDSGILPFSASFFNQSEHSTHWAWDFGDGSGSGDFSPTHEYQDTGHYEVILTATTTNGCRDTAVQKVIVGADFTIYIPNAFTPNGDGLNDYWHVNWIGVETFHVMLFDRWGMMIFESSDPDFQWDAILHGKACQEGIYTYVIQASGYLREKMKRAGTVTLIR